MTNVYSKQTLYLYVEMTLNLLNTVLGSYENYFFLEKNSQKIICTITINLNLKIYTKVWV